MPVQSADWVACRIVSCDHVSDVVNPNVPLSYTSFGGLPDTLPSGASVRLAPVVLPMFTPQRVFDQIDVPLICDGDAA